MNSTSIRVFDNIRGGHRRMDTLHVAGDGGRGHGMTRRDSDCITALAVLVPFVLYIVWELIH